MDLNELRETKAKLEHVVNYCPPETASDYAWEAACISDYEWEAACIAAESAAERYAELEDSFALLDAVDALTARLDQIEKSLACGGCGQAVAWTCPHCGWANAGAPGIEGAHWEEDLLERSNHDR